MTKLVIFDLDGTLLYTLESIAVNVNQALADYNLPEIPLNDYKYLVGNAADFLIHGALAKVGASDDLFAEVRSTYQKYFAVGCNYHVAPYDGVKDLLHELSARGIQCAVFSNKQHEQAISVVEEHFGKGTFAYIQGQEPDLPRKPDPSGVSRICEKVGVTLGDVLYLGDSDVDMKTGLGAGVKTVGVLWGYRTREELEVFHPAGLIEQPEELLKYLD